MGNKAVIVFLRTPEKGRVKTRLSRSLDDVFVLDLYKAFVKDTLDILETCEHTFLYFWPPGKKEMVQQWLGNKYRFSVQKGNDLGQKMSNAFVDIFQKGYTKALLMGTDIPELSNDIILRAFQSLLTADAVIGPSGDGGYYLIGFQKLKFSKKVFKKIDWSTEQVLNQTLEIMDAESIRCEMLPKLNDIDTPEDLAALAVRVKNGSRAGKRTLKLLKSYED